MNILAGQFGGRRIKTVSKLPYRPIKSRVRKSIFDSLMPFRFSMVLDLFSGSGILGFEAVSRGAQSVTFVEKHGPTLRLIKQNAAALAGPSYTFKHCGAVSFLRRSGSFDLIFADPPYGTHDLEPLAETILEHLNKKGKFILECEKDQAPFLDAIATDYGQTRILCWENS
ncbi:MAG: RsmD family RNA methyltransferase [Candidatus Marinimicrobia bacterium]|nr:RsmD family RNA methyltransferase [Candidatus Neomarinimicrobiota bacterium]